MHKDIERILVTEEEINARVKELGRQITEDYKDSKDLIVVCILKGAAPFMCDLIKHIDLDINIDFMQISSYGSGTVSTGVAKIVTDLSQDIKGKDILVCEDILDTHLTVDVLNELFKKREPKSFTVASLLYKNRPDLPAKDRPFEKYIGFTIEDEFVVGYGLDYDQTYRNLPYIGVLSEKVYKGEN